MSESTGIVLAIGGITVANEVLFAPLTGHGTPWKDFNWRVVPATAGLALALAGLEKLAPKFAVSVAYIALAAVLIVPFGNAPTPIENAVKVMGFK